MNHILKLYYGIQEEIEPPQYFHFQNQLYYFSYVQNPHIFLQIFQYYRYLIQNCQCPGYSLVKNNNEDVISYQHVLLVYHDYDFHFQNYLTSFLQPIPHQRLFIYQIKEQWICKIDSVKELVKQYAYSFKHNPELVSLIYYYTGLAENCINILNEILSIHKNASIAMGLALKHTISDYVHELLNPMNYVISSRMRHLVYLLRSQLLTYDMLEQLLETHYFDVYEILYFYARLFFPSHFFNEVLSQKISQERIDSYFVYIEEERKMYQEITKILSFYVTLPKISWINKKNMI